MIKVHHLNHSRSHKILWLLEELKLPYEIVPYTRDSITMLAPDTLRAIHPLGAVPVIEDDGKILAESGAITNYLLTRYDQEHNLWPEAQSNSWHEYLYWLHYTEGSLMPLLTQKLLFNRISQPPIPWFLRPFAKMIGQGMQRQHLDPQILRHIRYIEQQLNQSLWLAGDHLSGVDIHISYALEAILMRTNMVTSGPILEFIQRTHTRPAYKAAIEKGGDFKILT